jgi:hypothetical protein
VLSDIRLDTYILFYDAWNHEPDSIIILFLTSAGVCNMGCYKLRDLHHHRVCNCCLMNSVSIRNVKICCALSVPVCPYLSLVSHYLLPYCYLTMNTYITSAKAACVSRPVTIHNFSMSE